MISVLQLTSLLLQTRAVTEPFTFKLSGREEATKPGDHGDFLPESAASLGVTQAHSGLQTPSLHLFL